MCCCGHPLPAHTHYRRGADCALCACRRYRRLTYLDRLDSVLWLAWEAVKAFWLPPPRPPRHP